MRFDSYHPALNLLFFVAVIVAALWWNHPVFVGIAYVCSFAYSIKLNGKRSLIVNLILIPCMVAFACWYATINHFGITNLGKTIIGNNITLESIVYGGVLAVMVGSAIMWLTCVFAIFTTDKVEYLLGRVSPRLALFFSLAVRAVPVLRTRARAINVSRSGIGKGHGQGSVWHRIVNWVGRVSILITWIIERFVSTAESMRSRGSLLAGRTAYSIYRFDGRDRTFFLVLIACVAVLAAGVLLGQTSILYSPEIIFNRITPLSCAFYVAYALFCLLPFGLQVRGERRMAHCIEANVHN